MQKTHAASILSQTAQPPAALLRLAVASVLQEASSRPYSRAGPSLIWCAVWSLGQERGHATGLGNTYQRLIRACGTWQPALAEYGRDDEHLGWVLHGFCIELDDGRRFGEILLDGKTPVRNTGPIPCKVVVVRTGPDHSGQVRTAGRPPPPALRPRLQQYLLRQPFSE